MLPEDGRSHDGSVLTRDALLRYLAEAAHVSGKASKEDAAAGKCCPHGQANYSLYWYFHSLIGRDLDPSFETYRPVLDAYLGAGLPDIVHPPAITAEQIAATRQELDRLYPPDTSAYPLNDQQVLAVCKGLSYPISLVQGPPGTGKTGMICHLITLALARGETVAMVSSNSKAVDNVVETVRGEDGLAARKLAELGSSKKRSASKLMLGGRLAAFGSGRHCIPDGDYVTGWEKTLRFQTITGAYPFVTSTVHSLKKCFADGDKKAFDLLIMDEASQASVLVGIVALSCARRAVVVGDQEQLPPVLTDATGREISALVAKDPSLDCVRDTPYDLCQQDGSFLRSCYEVFQDDGLTTFLADHYRCHPAIIGFCNREVYGGRLNVRTHVERDAQGRPVPPLPIRVAWYEGEYREKAWMHELPASGGQGSAGSGAERAADDDGREESGVVNRKQLRVLEYEEAGHIRELVRQGASLCFLSPFRAQVAEIRKVLERVLAGIASPEAIEDGVLPAGDDDDDGAARGVPLRELTIHKAQGREFDAVYLLPVEDGDWEWPWSQGRRLINVAASRAKKELDVIVSTKLMDEGLQRALGVRHVIEGASDPKHDPREQQLYVRKLCRYVWELQQGLGAGELGRYGFHRSAILSAFDDVPHAQEVLKGEEANAFAAGRSGTRRSRARIKDYAPERCMQEVLEGCARRAGLLCASNVGFAHMRREDGKSVAELAGGTYFADPEEAHFDFVLFEPDTCRVAMALEVDGAFHRYARTKRHRGQPRHRDEGGTLRDARKDALVMEELDGAPCRLIRPFDRCVYGPPTTSRDRRTDGLVKGGVEPRGFQALGDGRTVWALRPSEMAPGRSFVFLRVPSDGSTFCETDDLRQRAIDKHPGWEPDGGWPPTIDEYLHEWKRENHLDASDPPLVPGLDSPEPMPHLLYVDAGTFRSARKDMAEKGAGSQAGHPERPEGDARPSAPGIRAVLEGWKADSELAGLLEGVSPHGMNEALVAAGILKPAPGTMGSSGYRPTTEGAALGITAVEFRDRKTGRTTPFCAYQPAAVEALRARLPAILRKAGIKE